MFVGAGGTKTGTGVSVGAANSGVTVGWAAGASVDVGGRVAVARAVGVGDAAGVVAFGSSGSDAGGSAAIGTRRGVSGGAERSASSEAAAWIMPGSSGGRLMPPRGSAE